jgi:hypothetical protein
VSATLKSFQLQPTYGYKIHQEKKEICRALPGMLKFYNLYYIVADSIRSSRVSFQRIQPASPGTS